MLKRSIRTCNYAKNKLQDVDVKAVPYHEPDELIGASEKASTSRVRLSDGLGTTQTVES